MTTRRPTPADLFARRLFRASLLNVTVGTMAALALPICTSASAQTHKVAATEHATRAVSVYEWTGDLAKPTAARLVPVSLFINDAFQDGGTFYARPIPLTLLNGNIYSLEKAGVPQGNVTLDYARHLQTATSGSATEPADLGWFGYGTYAPLPPPKKEAPLRASHTLSAVISSKDPDNKPHFSNSSDKPGTDASGKPAQSSTTAGTAPAEDSDRPHFSKPPAASAPDTTAPPTPATPKSDATTPPPTSRGSDSEADPDRPTLRHRDPRQAEADRKARGQSGVTAIPGALNSDPDRPTMKRGTGPGAEAPPSQLSGLPASLHQAVAVSDAVTREPHPFARDWSTPEEHDTVQAKLRTLAQQQVEQYARNNGGAGSPVAPPQRRATRTPKPLTPVLPAQLTGEQLAAYTLSYGGLPTFVYTAIAPATAPATGTLTPSERYVTLVAQQLPSGELQVAFKSVTDAAHLDRNPWFRFVDVVDPDAGHRASLLFELRGQTSRQFALYRILSATADQIFVTSPTE